MPESDPASADLAARLAAIELVFAVAFMEFERRNKPLHDEMRSAILEAARDQADPDRPFDLEEAVRRLCDFV